MARFVDLEAHDGGDGAAVEPSLAHRMARSIQQGPLNDDMLGKDEDPVKSRVPNGATQASPAPPPPMRTPVTDAFQCYPVVLAIVSCIDRNTLDALSRTSRAIHSGLLQHRSILLANSLRCTNDSVPINPEDTLRFRARASNWQYMEDSRGYNGKAALCARDMVGECERCAEVICRNCAIKPPAPVALRDRHRRLCTACSRAPIEDVTVPGLDLEMPWSLEIIHKSMCLCDSEGVWLCQPCGRSIRGADREYQRIWRWRSLYGEVLGGLGTGIGDGDRGVICGREGDCCAAKEREQEIDCDAEDAKDTNIPSPWTTELSGSSPPTVGQTPTPPPSSGSGSHNPLDLLIDDTRHERTPSPQLGPGYARHEIEGIGGVVKRKLVRMVRVGACVPEWDDEHGVGCRPLKSEVCGEARSWCGWCWKVIPGEKDRARLSSRTIARS